MRPVQQQPVADRAAEHFIDRHAQCLRLDIDQRVLDRGDRHRVDAAGGLPRRRVEIGRVALDRARVLADQALGHFPDDPGQPLRAIPLHVFRPADDALVGRDLEKRIDPPPGIAVQVFDLDDFHTGFSAATLRSPGESRDPLIRRSSGDGMDPGFRRDAIFGSRRSDIIIPARDLGEDRFEVGQEQIRVLAHREMPEFLHDRDLGAGHGARHRQRVLGRAGIIVFAGQQVQRALRRVDAVEFAAHIAVDAVKVQIAFEHAGAALHVVPQRFPALGLGRLRRDETGHGAGRDLAAMHVRAVQPARVVIRIDMRRAFEPDQRPERTRMAQRQMQHDPAADRAAHHDRPLQPERGDKRHDDAGIGIGGQPVFLVLPAGGRRRFAVKRQVERDDPKPLGDRRRR